MTVVTAAACLAACAHVRHEVTLGQLLEANTVARGGAAAIGHLHAVKFALEITEPKFTVAGHYVATRDGFMRIDIVAGGERVYTEALGPDGAWQMHRGEAACLPESEAGAAALRRGLAGNLYSLQELAQRGYSLRLIGPVARNKKNYWAIESRAPDGFPEVLYLDKKTDLVERQIDWSALHPDIDTTKKRFETLHLDYQPTSGIQFSRRSEKRDLDTDEIVQTAVVKTVTINPAVDPSIFRCPS